MSGGRKISRIHPSPLPARSYSGRWEWRQRRMTCGNGQRHRPKNGREACAVSCLARPGRRLIPTVEWRARGRMSRSLFGSLAQTKSRRTNQRLGGSQLSLTPVYVVDGRRRAHATSSEFRSTLYVQIRQRLLEVLDAGAGDLGVVEPQFFELSQPIQVHEPVVGDLRAVEVQHLEIGQRL